MTVDRDPVQPGRLFIISGPSGAGKTSLVNALVAADPDLVLSVSHTTRGQRPGERDGVHYHFVTTAEFERLKASDELLESAAVFDNAYGTARPWVQTHLDQGTSVILEIDWQGARQVRARLDDTASAFILPPSRETLEERLRARKQDSDAVIERRIRDAVSEMSHHDEFDYLVVNGDFDEALADLQTIVRAEGLRGPVQRRGKAGLLHSLLA